LQSSGRSRMRLPMSSPFRKLISSLPLAGLIALLVSISLSPRIPLPYIFQGRVLELRVDDLIVAVMLFFWLIYLAVKPRLFFPSIGRSFAAFLIIGFFSTAINALRNTDINISRFVLYNLKDFEYFAIFLLVANCVRKEKDVTRATWSLLIAGLMNVLWVVCQMISRKSSPLLVVSWNTFNNPNQFCRYAVCTIGEYSPFSVCGYFGLVSLLAYSCYMQTREEGKKRFRNLSFFFLALLLSLSSIASGEKISFLFIAVAGLMFFRKRIFTRKLRVGTFALAGAALFVILGATMMVCKVFPDVGRVMDIRAYRIQGDRIETWKPLIASGMKNALLGTGKGAQFAVETDGTVSLKEEAHNHYVKVFMETGVIGLLAFLWLLITAGRVLVRNYTRSRVPAHRAVTGTALMALLCLSVLGILQDAFKPVLINELFWAIVGLAMACQRIEENS
jgi:O-antigen ligase